MQTIFLAQRDLNWYPIVNSKLRFTSIDNPDLITIPECIYGNTYSCTDSNLFSMFVSVDKIKETRRIFIKSLLYGRNRMTFEPGKSTSVVRVNKTNTIKATKAINEYLMANLELTDHNERLIKKGLFIIE